MPFGPIPPGHSFAGSAFVQCRFFVTVSDPFGNCCPATNQVLGNPVQDGTYQASQLVTCDTLIPPNGNVIFQSGDQIILEPTFEVENGAIFEAKIDACN